MKIGDPLLKVVDLDPIFITLNVTENEISILKDQSALVSISDKKYSGQIHYISRTADELTRNFKVQIKLKNPENKIISGLSSEVEIGTTSEDAFFISSSLISLDNKGAGVKVIIEKKVPFFLLKF